MLLGFQRLKERIIAEGTTQLRSVPSIIDIIGCDITIENIQSAKQELINQKFDLKLDVNNNQDISTLIVTTPMIHFCSAGNLLIVKLLFLIGADCTQLSVGRFWFPMLAAAARGHLDICKWLFKYGGHAKDQINKETPFGHTPLELSYKEWYGGRDKEGKTCRWLLRNGGGQHLSSEAMGCLRIKGVEEMNSNLLVLWMRENIQLYDTFVLFLCGAANRIATSSLVSKDGGTRKRKRKPYQERSLQILDGHPGITEMIGEYVGVIRGKEFRMLKEFNELAIEHTTDESSSNDDDNS